MTRREKRKIGRQMYLMGFGMLLFAPIAGEFLGILTGMFGALLVVFGSFIEAYVE